MWKSAGAPLKRAGDRKGGCVTRYRMLDPDFDMTFGQGEANFLVNSPACVGQAVMTRLRLLQGEWFLDNTVTTPYSTKVFVAGGKRTADQAIRTVILQTPGVKGIKNYASAFDANRNWTVSADIDTIYGEASISGPVGSL